AKYPRFKSLKKSNLGLKYIKSGLSLRNGKVKLAKHAEPLDIVWSRPVDLSAVSSATVTRDKAGRWFISLLAAETVTPKPIKGRTVGIDLGAKDALVTSAGSRHNPGGMFDVKKEQALVTRRHKDLSRTQHRSMN